MAEAVGAAASIAGLLSLTIQLIEISRRYISSCKSRSQTIEAIHRELEALKQVFTEVRRISNTPHYQPYLSSLSVSKVDGCYYELERLHSRVRRQEQGSGLSKKVNAFVWPFNETECRRLIKNLHSYQSSFHTAISADSFKLNVEALDRIDKQVLEQFLREFSSAEFRTNQKEAWKKHEPGTGTWFLESGQYTDWLRKPNGRLCLYGLPGTGKTVLCSIAIGDIDARRDEHDALVYFYFDFRALDKQSTADCLRSLIVQMISLLGSIPPELLWLMGSCGPRDRMDLDEKDLVSALSTLSKHFLRTYIVIDALDESTEKDQIANVLLEIAAQEECHTSWLVTCRREKGTEALKRDPLLRTITLEGSAVDRDIEVYVRKCLSVELSMLPAQIKRKVEAVLLEKADGMSVEISQYWRLSLTLPQVPLGGMPATKTQGLSDYIRRGDYPSNPTSWPRRNIRAYFPADSPYAMAKGSHCIRISCICKNSADSP
jgi:ankyrin repeat domain-containing protein 50